MILVLDSDAVDALASRSPKLQRVKQPCAARSRVGRRRDFQLRHTDRPLASFVGGVLTAACAGTEDIVDAYCVATVVERGRGVVLTGDPDDLNRLAAAYPTVTISST